jgi:diguanylate cyclase (GGDEF)-like protein/PAS domain S-box-containing protein
MDIAASRLPAIESVEDGLLDAMTLRLRDASRLLKEGALATSTRHRFLAAMVDHVPDYIYAKDLEGRFLFANAAVVRDNGLTNVDDIVGLTDADLHGKDAAHGLSETERRVMETGEPDFGVAERGLKHDRWLMMSRVPLRDDFGTVIGVVGASRDVSAHKRAEDLMRAQAALLKEVARGVSLSPFIENVRETLEALCERRTCEIHLTRDVVDGFTFDHDPVSPGWAIPILSDSGEAYGTVVVLESFGDDVALSEFVSGVAQTIGIAIDRDRDARRIEYLAKRDALTGLPNRAELDRQLHLILAAAREAGDEVAVAFLDLDSFKLVNDSLGHAAGDELLRRVAARISDEVGANGLVSRVGGDEFVVVMTRSQDAFEQRLTAIRSAVSKPMALEGMNLQVTCSIGVACFDRHGDTPAELFANADVALYKVKENGRNDVAFFSSAMADETRRKLQRLEELRAAVDREEFVLHYQPQRDVRTGKVIGVEALVRWNHPERGLVYPGDFIPLAEESGLIVRIGETVLSEACRQAVEWQEAGLPPVKIGVNMSARQFQDPFMPAQVSNVLRRTGLHPSLLEIEVTESLLMQDVDGAVSRMHELNAQGVKLAIDDFGTGYSSLSTLKKFPLSRLKIDRSFIRDVPGDADDMAIASAIVSLAGILELDVVAEGVETDEQAAFLKDVGCNVMQGYLYGRPMAPEAVAKILS